MFFSGNNNKMNTSNVFGVNVLNTEAVKIKEFPANYESYQETSGCDQLTDLLIERTLLCLSDLSGPFRGRSLLPSIKLLAISQHTLVYIISDYR